MPEDIIEKKEEKIKPEERYVPPLPKYELFIHVIVWFTYVFLSGYKMYQLSYNKKTRKYFQEQGYIEKTIFGLYKSSHEYLWYDLEVLVYTGWSFFVAYVIISRFLRGQTNPMVFMLGCTVLSIFLNYWSSSMKFLYMESAIFLSFIIAGFTRCKTLIWIMGLAMLHYMRDWARYEFFENSYLFGHAFPYTALLITRGITIGINIAQSSKYTTQLLLEMSFYYWYFPAIIGCRMMTIREFIDNVYKPYVIENWKKWFTKAVSVAFYFFAWSLVSYLVHIHLVFMTHDLKSIHSFYLYGSHMIYGIHFYMYYVVAYNSIYLLTQFDGFLTTEGPECISHIALYSRMWRNFDRGLHVWLKDLVFRPIVRMGHFQTTRHIAALACFGFVVVFHGLERSNLLWISINILQYYAEHLAKYTYNETWFGSFMEKHFSQTMIRRIIGIAGGLSFFFSVYAFAAFQFGINAANSIFGYMFKNDSNYLYNRFFFVAFFVYSHSQMSINTCEYLRRQKAKTD